MSPAARSARSARSRSGRLGAVLCGFPPIVGPAARVLVLGSMPGSASLAAQQYYAHPRNSFWRLCGELADAGPERDYADRAGRLAAAGVAVWDVLAACVRRGSLDADIEPGSIVVNDFAGFFADHPGIRLVCCNGATAFSCYRRQVVPHLRGVAATLPVVRLPSTSPAHAGQSFEQKLQQWRAALAPWLLSRRGGEATRPRPRDLRHGPAGRR